MVKHFYFALFMVLISSTLAGNTYLHRNNATYIVLQPGDFGIGLRYDRHFGNNGVYTSLAKGRYRLPDGGYINDHYKASLGYMRQLPLKTNKPVHDYALIGLTYHTYGARQYGEGIINEKVFKPISFEVGVGANIFRFKYGIRFDILKHEGSIDFGFTF
ncbi:MAG: hypothetical protein KA807_16330 [Prolixibacteraceae bacterium]|nr:hypothetical protein [Prolixibacteraceae bacterium]